MLPIPRSIPRCANTIAYENEVEYQYNGHTFTFHRIALILCALFGIIAVVISYILMQLHASHYSKPWEQKHIIRILFMVPVYAVVSFLSFYYYRYAVYWELIRDCYEAFAIASFFTLMCHYVAPSLHDQKEYFRTVQPKRWVWPVTWMGKCTGGEKRGIFRTPTSGLTWFNICWIGVFQYCFVRPFLTLVAVITQALGLYCIDSLKPYYAHLWCQIFIAISVSIAMFFLIQFYVQMRKDLVQHRPFLKLLSIKLVIFFCFWQTLLISFLASSSGPLHTTAHIGRADIVVGIPSTLLCVEMALFAILHIFAYPYTPYKIGHAKATHALLNTTSHHSDTPDSPTSYQGGTIGIMAWLDAFNPWDIIKACGRGFKWLFHGSRHRKADRSYSNQKDSNTEGIKLTTMDDNSSTEEKPLPVIPPAAATHIVSGQSYAYQPYHPPQGQAYPDSSMGPSYGYPPPQQQPHEMPAYGPGPIKPY